MSGEKQAEKEDSKRREPREFIRTGCKEGATVRSSNLRINGGSLSESSLFLQFMRRDHRSIGGSRAGRR